jgi:tetratricopeptide (TPR) repeat protein
MLECFNSSYRAACLLVAWALVIGGQGLLSQPANAIFWDNPPAAKTCPKGSVWSKRSKKCVALKSSDLTDEDLTTTGRALARGGRYDEAIQVLNEVKNKNDPLLLTYLGYSLRKLGHTDLGITYYKQALQIDPNNVDTREYLGEGYLTKGRIDLARVELAEIEKRCGIECEQYQYLELAIQGSKPY